MKHWSLPDTGVLPDKRAKRPWLLYWSIDTAFSLSLVAVDTTGQAIQSGAYYRAVAGGTKIITSPYHCQI